WPFLMFTGRFCEQTLRMKFVCRTRNAGVCNTSTTAATSGSGVSSCTSVSTGRPSWRFTSDRMRSPSSMPGPRKLFCEERFALSKDDLMMKGMPSRPVSSLSLPATSRTRPSLSTTQGPAIRNSGWSGPTVKLSSFTSSARSRGLRDRHLLLAICPRRFHETGEQRMTVARRRAEFRVKLARYEERMRRQLDHLHQPVAREAGEAQPRIHHLLQVAVVELVAVTVPLLDQVGAVDLVRARAVRQPHFLRAEPHRAAQLRLVGALLDRALLVLPLGDQRDYRVRRRVVELGGMRALQVGDVARVLD